MRIIINLATRPYADQSPALKRLRIGMAALAVVLIALGFGLMHFHQSALRMAAQEEAINRSIENIRQEEQGYQAQMQQPANARVLKQAGFLNGLFEEKSFSWTAAMEDLERVLPAGVQVTAIEPARAKDGRLTLRLKVSGLRERSVEMLRNMEHSRRFVSPRIAGENAETSSQGDLQPVRDVGPNSNKVSFDILAEYNPATLEERKAEIAAQKHRHSDSTSGAAESQQANPRSRRPYVAPGMAPGMHPNRMPVPGTNRYARPDQPQLPQGSPK
jgi:type IV pilus assembly protein PilN